MSPLPQRFGRRMGGKHPNQQARPAIAPKPGRGGLRVLAGSTSREGSVNSHRCAWKEL